MDLFGDQGLSVFMASLLLLVATAAGDLEPTFGRCCAYGANWARESQACSSFPTIMAAIPTEHQSVCITAAAICCLRYFRDEQCQKGKQVAQVGQDCVASSSQGGEYFKDCCQGCKLGLFSGSMGMGCSTRFKFGFPWDYAYLQCCNQASPSNTSPNLPGNQEVDTENLYPGLGILGPQGIIPDSENLCAKLPGKLCSDLCVPTPGSYRCMCRAGFTLSVDGKTCIQDTVTDRCQVNNPCDHVCRDTGVSIVCSCNRGFTLKADRKSCEDVNECTSGVHGCVAVEQVCYNLVGSYVCINADGSFSAPGPTPLQGSFPGSLPSEPRPPGFEISNEIAQGRSPFISGSGALGVQGFPGANRELGLSGLSHSQGRCPPGYSFNLERQACDDVDECEVTSGLCGRGGICQNTIGSYTCTHVPVADCPPGFAFDLNLQSCLDADECVDGTNNCNWTTHFCVNTQGGYMCQEKSGSTDCVAGYKFSTQQNKCIDVDECAEELHGCHPDEETCRNTDGAYECDMMCEEGFQFSPILRSCVDQDECVDAPCEPGWECRNTVGSYLCHELPRAFCPAGYKPSNGTASGCEDVDECVEGLHSCHTVREFCINEIGKYRCETIIIGDVNADRSQFERVSHATFQPPVQECPDGFGYDLTSRQCLDINECIGGLDDCTHGERCVNTVGGFVCQPRVRCPAGLAPDSVTGECRDVDECAAGVANCLPGQICFNTPGAFECRVDCQDGFRYDPADDPVCADVDECLQSPCSFGENCHNTEGSYICTISSNTTTSIVRTTTIPSTTSTPTMTTPAMNFTCPPGFGRNPNTMKCEDVNECETEEHNCNLPKEECVNTHGTYRCKPLPDCPVGFTRDATSLRCVDVDECVEGTHDCVDGERCFNQYGQYTCRGSPSSCFEGYRYNSLDRRCKDIDECTEKSDTCDRATQTCVNSKGSFRCIDRQPTCDFGYRYNEDQEACVDIDECEEGRDFCNKLTEICVNSEGNYWCSPILDLPDSGHTHTSTTTSTTILKPPPLPPLPPKPDQAAPQCPLGTEYNLLLQACVDIDECITDPCKSLEVCENTQGSFQCQCQLGYYREEPDEDCQDMNECQLDVHTCTSTQRCDNTIGSYACVRIAGCGTGYTLNHNTGLCDDNDECKLNTHNCDQLGPKYQCVNIKGSFRCRIKTCPPLHILNDEGLCIARTCDVGYRPGEFNCIDIDECIEDNPCKQNERCINTLGSYRCQPLLICNIGYEMNEVGTQCIDIDECARGTHQCEGNQVCSNRQGGYVCQCPPGYRLNAERQCQDINECESYYGRVCANNAVCVNTEGSFRCNCKEGFKQASNNVSCIDVDECLEVPGICHHNCINVWGTYQCTCQAGHILDSDNRTCTDVDECENFRGRGHLCIGLCVNIPGSFKCTCPDGYSLAADGRTCKDINECESGSVCLGIDEQCVNTRGSYKCNTITCPDNYVRDQRHKNRCKKLTTYCPPNDEECPRRPLSYSYNYLPLVSNMTLSSLGQVDLFTMRGPLWASTTVQFELELEDTSAPASVEPVTREHFQLRRTAFNQAVISLVKTIIGPQEILLSLNMQLYQQGRFSGSAVAKLMIYVSEHTF